MLGILGAALAGRCDGQTSVQLADTVTHALAAQADPNAVRIRGRVRRGPTGKLVALAEVTVGGVVFELAATTALHVHAALYRELHAATDREGAKRLTLYAYGLRTGLDAADRIIAAQRDVR